MRSTVVGAGKLGYELARLLAGEGHDVVVIDHHDEALVEVRENLDVMTIRGSMVSAGTLAEADVQNTDLFVAVTHIDEVNIIGCMMARHLGAGTTVARIRNEDYQGLTNWGLTSRQLGIDLVINPEEAVAYEIVKFLKSPAATDVEYFGGGRIQMLGYRVQEGSPIAGRTVAGANITYGTVGAILRDDRVVVPHGDTKILPGDEMLVLGPTGVPTELGWLVGRPEHAIRTAAVYGAGPIGFRLAQFLERHWAHGPTVKLIDADAELCEARAELLSKTSVICGDGSRPELLQDEGIATADAFIAVTGDERTNLLAGFMAKHMGVRQVIVELNRKDLIPLADKMGIEVTIIPRVVVSRAILRLVHKASVVSLSLLKEGDLEAIEISVSPTCRFCRVPLRKLELPSGVVIGGIIRNETVLVPRGDTQLLPGDHVVIFASPAVAPAVENMFA